MKMLTIDNSKKSAIQINPKKRMAKQWKDPGAKLYDQLLDSLYVKNGNVPTGAKELDEAIKNGDYLQWDSFIKEAYAVAPVKNINNSPYGRTSFSRSGCKYPHHEIKGNKLVVSIPGLRAAYICARNQGVLINHTPENKAIVAHFNKHFNELGVKPVWHYGELYIESTEEVDYNAIMESNFNDIFLYLMQETGINLFDNSRMLGIPSISFNETDLIPDDKLIDYLDEGFDEFLEEINSSEYLIEAAGMFRDEKESKKQFKQRWKYDEKKQTIRFENREFKIDINTDIKNFKGKYKMLGKEYEFEDKKDLCVVFNGIDGPVIIVNKYFWDYIPDYQDACILHELGHIVCQMTPKPFPKSIKELIERIKKAIQRLVARVRMRKYVKGVHGNGYHEIEADMWAAHRIPSNTISSLLKTIYGMQLAQQKEELIKEIKKINKKEEFRDRYDKNEKIKSKMSFDEYYDKIIEKEVRRITSEYTLHPEKNDDIRQRVAALNDKKLYNSKYFKKESVEFPGLNGDNTHLTLTLWKEIGGKDPEHLYKWMYNNISYDDNFNPKTWKLKSPEELYMTKSGICHDQSFFSVLQLHSLGYICGQLFFVECTELGSPDGNAHTLTWYRETIEVTEGDGDKGWHHNYYWFETAWETQLGIHGPYVDIEELKHAVINAYNKDDDINSHNPKYQTLAISTDSNYRKGMSMNEYITSWCGMKEYQYNDSLVESSDISNETFYRVSYNGIGIYEALRQQVSAEQWKKYLKSDAFTWLPKPNEYAVGYKSYFTKDGIDKYNELVAPIIDSVIGNNVTFETFKGSEIGNIIYRDQYQVITDSSDDKSLDEAMSIIEDMVNGNYIFESDMNTYDPPMSFDQLPNHLKNDEVHVWRAKHGIELIHKEPTLEELERIWKNWNLMTQEQKVISNNESIRLFGMDNKTHYEKLCIEYDTKFANIDTVNELLTWMDNIEYGWISKKDGKIYGTGEDDDETEFFKYYYLQSPWELMRSKNGVCWDQVELERHWFKENNFNCTAIYIEINDEKECPTHTFIIYKDKNKFNWLEHSWGIFKGIHSYNSINQLLTDVVSKHQKFNNDTTSPVIIKSYGKPNYGESCEEFMNFCRSSESINMDAISDSIFWESYDLNNLPDVLYFSSPTKLDSKTISAKPPRGLFLSPYIGISSMFIIDRFKIFSDYFNEILVKNHRTLNSSDYNIEYDEWYLSDGELIDPLTKVHMHHNIPEFREVKSGTSTGFIYAIDVSSVKNELQAFSTNDANREVIYKGSSKLPIKEIKQHTIQWEISYKKGNKRGTFTSRQLTESVLSIKTLNSYIENVSNNIDWFVQEDDFDVKMSDYIMESKSRNGNSRRYLYNEFIKYAKDSNDKNKFHTNYDGDLFIKSYPFVPYNMRFFYRVANPELCVIDDKGKKLVFFQLSELEDINKGYNQLKEMMIFAATTKNFRVLNIKDNKVYLGIDQNKKIVLQEVLANNFDLYIQALIGRDDII